MSYASSLLMAYPPPYGPSTLLSDDLIQRASFGAAYEPSMSYRSNSHLPSDDFVYNPISRGPLSYRSPTYSHLPPPKTYRTSSITDWQRNIPARTSYNSVNDVREYSQSLATVSNTNTASSVTHSTNENNLNGATNIFPNYQSRYHRFSSDVDRHSPFPKVWSPTRAKFPSREEKPAPTYRSLPELSTTKRPTKSPVKEAKEEATPIPSPLPSSPPPVLAKQETNLQRNATIIQIEKQQPAAEIPIFLTEGGQDSPIDENAAEQAWTEKVDQMHITQAQREKEKAKAARALPNQIKKADNKSSENENKPHIPSPQKQNDSYLDTLFDGNYYRKPSINQQNINSSYQQTFSSRKKSTTDPLIKPKTTKQASPRKVLQYEPPSISRVPPPTTWKKQETNQNQNGSLTPREMIHKDTDERFREALQKFRADRAEQQQKEITESTAKRLNYGNYIRRSTREGSLHTIIKPLPWSDFLEMKKGNVYSLTKEEKKDRYNQSKSYGERVRYRNFALHHAAETNRSPRRLFPIPIEDKELQSGDETSHEQHVNDNDHTKFLKRSVFSSTVKTSTKDPIHRDTKSTRSDQSNTSNKESEGEDEVVSDFESSRKEKKKKIYDSSIRTTTASDGISDNDETSERESTRTKTRDTDDDLFTVREEKTQELL